MKIQKIDINKLIPYINNARTHSDEQVSQIAASIKEFGFNNPVLSDGRNGIIAGHGRILAAKKLGIENVPVVELSHLSETQKKAYILADNRLAENAGWDDEIVKVELESLSAEDFDIALTGFDFNIPGDGGGLTDDDEVPEVEEAITKLGDLWTLGEHRLLCGDSTEIEQVERLMDGQKADMVFTDPPYNVAFNGRSGKFEVIKNDDLSVDAFESFIGKFLGVLGAIGVNTYYICCNWKFYGLMQTKLKPKSCIVWAKNVFGLGRGYRHQHEFIIFDGFVDPDIKNESDLWEIKKDTNYKHPTQKPTAISERAIHNSSKIGNIVQDYFCGSGSTIIACQKTNRKCYGMELDPHYCDVIVKRWEEYTGNKAALTNDKSDT